MDITNIVLKRISSGFARAWMGLCFGSIRSQVVLYLTNNSTRSYLTDPGLTKSDVERVNKVTKLLSNRSDHSPNKSFRWSFLKSQAKMESVSCDVEIGASRYRSDGNWIEFGKVMKSLSLNPENDILKSTRTPWFMLWFWSHKSMENNGVPLQMRKQKR